MAGKRPIMRYSDNVNSVHVYDVVRIKRGYFKDKLAICVWVDFAKRELKLKIIDNGIDITLHKNSVDFCYHNTKTAAKQWFGVIEHNCAKNAKNWSDIKYIKEHWNDLLAKNSYTARAIAKIAQIHRRDDDAYLEWLEYYCRCLDIIFGYPDIEFCDILIKDLARHECKEFREDIVRKIHSAVWKI
jgi:hypothetical protein